MVLKKINRMMRIAIIGSREFKDKKLFNKVMGTEIYASQTIITGGARGIDTWAVEFAKKYGVSYEVIPPLDKSKKIDYLFRNCEIIGRADKIIAFWDGSSKGSKFVIDYAKKRGKDIKVIR